MERAPDTNRLNACENEVQTAFLSQVNRAMRARSKHAVQFQRLDGWVRVVRPARNVAVLPDSPPMPGETGARGCREAEN